MTASAQAPNRATPDAPAVHPGLPDLAALAADYPPLAHILTLVANNQATAALGSPPSPGHPGLPDHIPRRRAWKVDEARQLLGGISRKSIYDLIKSGELRTVMIAGRRLVPDDAISEVIARGTSETWSPIRTGRNVLAESE
jgi:hypothetical protein